MIQHTIHRMGIQPKKNRILYRIKVKILWNNNSWLSKVMHVYCIWFLYPLNVRFFGILWMHIQAEKMQIESWNVGVLQNVQEVSGNKPWQLQEHHFDIEYLNIYQYVKFGETLTSEIWTYKHYGLTMQHRGHVVSLEVYSFMFGYTMLYSVLCFNRSQLQLQYFE